MTKLLSAIAIAMLLPVTAFAQGAGTAPQPSAPQGSAELGGMGGGGAAIAAGVALIAIVAIVASDDDDDDSPSGTTGTN